MTFTYEKDTLLYDGKVVYKTIDQITDCITDEFNSYALIIYKAFGLIPHTDLPVNLRPTITDSELQKKINQNMLCVDKNGQVIWRVAPTSNRSYDHVFFMSDTDGLWSHRRDGEEFKIDKKTGKILAQRLGAR